MVDGPQPTALEGATPDAAPARPPEPRSRRLRSARLRTRRRRLRALLLGLGALVVIAVAGAVVWYLGEADPGTPGRAVVVTIPKDAPVSEMAAILERDQVVGSTLALRVYFVLHGKPVVEPGAYYLRRHSSFGSVSTALAAGPDVFTLDVTPGLTVREVAGGVGDLPGHTSAAFSALATSGRVSSPYAPPGTDSLDGLLGTGAYVVVPGESDRALLGQMVGRFDRTAARVGLVPGAAGLGMTPYQVVTVASIVQKEGVYPENVAKVSRVIDNRLAADMALQMDSTVLYAEHRDGGTVTPADLAVVSPYNTYLNKGLPPTPVCFPSEASLTAALHPAVGSWLYFVVVEPDGTEAFADTYAEQLANEQLANEQLAKSRGLG